MRFNIRTWPRKYSHHRLNHRARQACCDLFALGMGILIGMYILVPLIHRAVDIWWTP